MCRTIFEMFQASAQIRRGSEFMGDHYYCWNYTNRVCVFFGGGEAGVYVGLRRASLYIAGYYGRK